MYICITYISFLLFIIYFIATDRSTLKLTTESWYVHYKFDMFYCTSPYSQCFFVFLTYEWAQLATVFLSQGKNTVFY